MKIKTFLVAACFLAVLALASFAQDDDHITKVSLSPQEIDKLVKTMADKEGVFRAALGKYSFKRDAVIQTLGYGAKQVTGEYHRTSLFTFDDKGVKYEKILFFPIPTLTEIVMYPEDLEDLGGVTAYALEPQNIPLYNFTLVGKQKIDELDLYVFDVAPKVMPDPKKTKLRLFQGRIWVDDRDLQIVKSRGKGVPETKQNKFPIVETWRENIGGKYWFPTYAVSNDELLFDNGTTVRLRMRVRYTEYKEGTATIRILDDDEDENPKPSPTPTPAPVTKKP